MQKKHLYKHLNTHNYSIFDLWTNFVKMYQNKELETYILPSNRVCLWAGNQDQREKGIFSYI